MKKMKLTDKKIKQMVFAFIGLGVVYLIYKKMKNGTEEKRAVYGPGGKDGLDNPIQGAYQGDKPRSTGNSTTTTTTLILQEM